jgi:hypothetical protein
MASQSDPDQSSDVAEFSRQMELAQPGLLRQCGEYLLHNKKWWLTPIVLILLIVGALLILGSSVAAPLIYTLF